MKKSSKTKRSGSLWASCSPRSSVLRTTDQQCSGYDSYQSDAKPDIKTNVQRDNLLQNQQSNLKVGLSSNSDNINTLGERRENDSTSKSATKFPGVSVKGKLSRISGSLRTSNFRSSALADIGQGLQQSECLSTSASTATTTAAAITSLTATHTSESKTSHGPACFRGMVRSFGRHPLQRETNSLFKDTVRTLSYSSADDINSSSLTRSSLQNKQRTDVQDTQRQSLRKYDVDYQAGKEDTMKNSTTDLDIQKLKEECERAIIESKKTLLNVNDTYERVHKKFKSPSKKWMKPSAFKLRQKKNNFIHPKFSSKSQKKVRFRVLPEPDLPTLYETAFSGDVTAIEILLDSGFQVNEHDEDNKTPLHYASEQGHTEVIQLLINKGAILDPSDSYSKTPLHYAIINERSEIVDILLDNGASPKLVDNKQKSALHYSAQMGDLRILKSILKKGGQSSIDSRDSSLKSPLHYAVDNCDFPITSCLLENGAKIDQTDGQRRSPLHYSTLHGDYAISCLLIENGATIDCLDQNLHTPLVIAVTKNHEKIVRYLLSKGASVDIVDTVGKTPLHIACEKGLHDVTEELLYYSASLSIKDSFGKIPLTYAVENRNKSIVDLLLQNGSNTDTSDIQGKSPLHYAVISRNNNLVYCLAMHELTKSNSKDVHTRLLEVALQTDSEYLGRIVFDSIMKLDRESIKTFLSPRNKTRLLSHEKIN